MTELGELVLDVLGEMAEFVWDLLPDGGKDRKNEDRPVAKPGYREQPQTPDTE